MSRGSVVYSIQRTYIIKSVSKSEKHILTCDERIDIPTIEPVTNVQAVVYDNPRTVVPCVELKMIDLSLEGINLVFETNEGATVLPVKIDSGRNSVSRNPYINERWVLALPRGATGIKSCKVYLGENGDVIPHNLTFGIMPPPYNYDNALFGSISSRVVSNTERINALTDKVDALKLTTKTPTFDTITLPAGAGRQTIKIEDGVLFYQTSFSYSSSTEGTIHHPKITLHGGGRHLVYTLSLTGSTNAVLIDLFAGRITVYNGAEGKIIQEFVVGLPTLGFETLSFDDFDDVYTTELHVIPKGAHVK